MPKGQQVEHVGLVGANHQLKATNEQRESRNGIEMRPLTSSQTVACRCRRSCVCLDPLRTEVAQTNGPGLVCLGPVASLSLQASERLAGLTGRNDATRNQTGQ